MIGFGWGNGAEGIDILIACKVSEEKKEETDAFCLLQCTIVNIEEPKGLVLKLKKK